MKSRNPILDRPPRAARRWKRQAATWLGAGLCLLFQSACLFLPVSLVQPKYFVSSQEMSPECMDAVFDYIRMVTGGWDARQDSDSARVASLRSTIEEAFTKGAVVSVFAQRTEDSPSRLMKFYFSRRGDRLGVVLIQAVVFPSKKYGGPGGWTSVYNTYTGGNVTILKCPGPFVGQDVTVGTDPVKTTDNP